MPKIIKRTLEQSIPDASESFKVVLLALGEGNNREPNCWGEESDRASTRRGEGSDSTEHNNIILKKRYWLSA